MKKKSSSPHLIHLLLFGVWYMASFGTSVIFISKLKKFKTDGNNSDFHNIDLK